MKFFVDSANLEDIELVLQRGVVRGVTTNPSLLAREPKAKFEDHIKKIVALLRRYEDGGHLSVEVFSTDPEEILRQAKHFVRMFKYPSLSIKIQIGWPELEIIKRLSDEGIAVNCTACMTVSQAVLAAQAGARYVSLFWGRIRDGGLDRRFTKERQRYLKDRVVEREDFTPARAVAKTRQILDQQQSSAKIIVGSIRGVNDIVGAGMAGAHIVTVPPKFFPIMSSHFKTDEVVGQFLNDFNQWFR